jgi:hypothetical protein
LATKNAIQKKGVTKWKKTDQLKKSQRST